MAVLGASASVVGAGRGLWLDGLLPTGRRGRVDAIALRRKYHFLGYYFGLVVNLLKSGGIYYPDSDILGIHQRNAVQRVLELVSMAILEAKYQLTMDGRHFRCVNSDTELGGLEILVLLQHELLPAGYGGRYRYQHGLGDGARLSAAIPWSVDDPRCDPQDVKSAVYATKRYLGQIQGVLARVKKGKPVPEADQPRAIEFLELFEKIFGALEHRGSGQI